MRFSAFGTFLRGEAALQLHVVTAAPADFSLNPLDWFTAIADWLTDGLNNVRLETTKIIVKVALPPIQELQAGMFGIGFGGTYGLANALVTFMVTLSMFIMVIKPRGDHAIRINRTVSSTFLVAIFGMLFFRLYSIAYDAAQALMIGLVNVATGKQTTGIEEALKLIINTAMPDNSAVRLFVAFFAFVISLLVFIIAFLNVAAIYLLGIFYIFPLALRPLHEKINDLFHIFNSGLITSLVTPILIVAGLLLPKWVDLKMSNSILTGLSALLGVVAAFVLPVLLALYMYKVSNKVFGAVDTRMAGNVGINQMPRVEAEIRESQKQSALGPFMTTFGVGAATAKLSQSDNLSGDLGKLFIEAAAAGATVSGHPLIGAGLSAMDTTLSHERRKHEAEQLQSMPPPTGSPVPVEPTPQPPAEPAEPTSPPPTPSPIQEWPK